MKSLILYLLSYCAAIFTQANCQPLDESGLSVSEVTGKTQSLMCFRNKHGEILIETPNKKVKSYYKLLGEIIPVSLKIKDFRRKIMLSLL